MVLNIHIQGIVLKLEICVKIYNIVMEIFSSVCACLSHLAELLPICVGKECFEGLEACIDALHAPAFIAVGDLTPDSPLLVLGCLWTEGDVGQAEGVRSKKRDHHHCVHIFTMCNEAVYSL